MAAPTGLLTKGVKFYYATYTASTLGSYTQLEGLQSFPDLGAAPEKVDVTTLADSMRHYIKGVQDLSDLDFTFLYDNSGASSNYRLAKALESEAKVSVKIEFPDTTTFVYDAQISVRITGGEVNAALQFVVNTSLLTDISVTNPT